MHRQVVAAHRLQEHHLQVQIVVGYHFGEHGIVVAEIQQLLLPFIGISQGASYAFAHKAAAQPFVIVRKGQFFHHTRSLSNGFRFRAYDPLFSPAQVRRRTFSLSAEPGRAQAYIALIPTGSS